MKRFLLMMVVALATLSCRAQETLFKTSRPINAGFVDVEDGSKKYNFFFCEGNAKAEKWYAKERVKLRKKLNRIRNKHNGQYKKYARKAEGTEDEQAWKKLQKLTDKYDKKKNKINDRIHKGDSTHVLYSMLYFIDPSFDPPEALLYKADRVWKDNGEDGRKWVCRNSELVAMKSNVNFFYDRIENRKITSSHMKVDDELMDSILSLVSIVRYTSLNMDEHLILIDGSRAYLFYYGSRVRCSQDADGHQALLFRTFGRIMKCVEEHDEAGLESLRPTINDLIAYYRTLILPDQYVSNWH